MSLMALAQIGFRISIRITINFFVTGWAEQHEVGGVVSQRFCRCFVMSSPCSGTLGTRWQNMSHFSPPHRLPYAIVMHQICSTELTMTCCFYPDNVPCGFISIVTTATSFSFFCCHYVNLLVNCDLLSADIRALSQNSRDANSPTSSLVWG